MDYHFEDFTEPEYRKLLRLAKASWELIPFMDYRKRGRLCLWRHDVDFSAHRAHRLAQIEAEEGVQATYFIHLHSKFYNALEDEVVERISKIQALGHILGLHFDPQFYSAFLNSRTEVLKQMEFERRTMQRVFKTKVSAFSIHIPELSNWSSIDADEVGGMINACGQYIKNNYRYCSDSNGYWRFLRLKDLLEAAEDERLHVLTHPEMWTPEPMSPRLRVTRCIEGRAARQHQWYDDILARAGRENVR
ncbi:MAG: hypothetical protein FJ023_09610 [Chloroflexi bacterium]|nr:hypothetical protein [Chloroflexota bacterium]